jgi:hypothetical protein
MVAGHPSGEDSVKKYVVHVIEKNSEFRIQKPEWMGKKPQSPLLTSKKS